MRNAKSKHKAGRPKGTAKKRSSKVAAETQSSGRPLSTNSKMMIAGAIVLVVVGLYYMSANSARQSAAAVNRGQQASTAQSGVTQPVTAGQGDFATYCSGCHGQAGEGGRGQKLAGTALTVSQIVAVVSKGRPQRGMPSFGATISGDRLAAVAAFVKTLR